MDALIYLCHKSSGSTPWNHLVQFPRPAVDVQNIADGLSQVAIGSSQTALSRQATTSHAPLSDATPAAIPDVLPPSYSEGNALGLSVPLPPIAQSLEDNDGLFDPVPVWALGYDTCSFPNSKFSFPYLTITLKMLSPLDYAFVRAREIDGSIIHSFKEIPAATVSVPSLGRNADVVIDSLGYPLSTLLQLRNAFSDAREVTDNPQHAFILEMVNQGMSILEAGMFYGLIEMPSREKVKYRQRMDFDVL